MVLNIENIDVAMSSFEQPKLTSKMLYHQNLDLKKKIHFNLKAQYLSHEKNWTEFFFLEITFKTMSRVKFSICHRRKKSG